MWPLGVMIFTCTPRRAASASARTASSSGTKYELDRWMLRSAAVMAIRYIRCMLSLPPVGELLNICAGWSPTGRSAGK